MESRNQMSLWEDSLAKTYRSPEWEARVQVSGESDRASSTSTSTSWDELCPELSSLKTSQVFSLATEAGTSNSLFARWPTSGMVWGGECLTAVTSESPSLAKESILLPVIETGEVPPRYFLSPNAAAGMLRRADRMGRTLFPPLRRALEILAKAQSSKA